VPQGVPRLGKVFWHPVTFGGSLESRWGERKRKGLGEGGSTGGGGSESGRNHQGGTKKIAAKKEKAEKNTCGRTRVVSSPNAWWGTKQGGGRRNPLLQKS